MKTLKIGIILLAFVLVAMVMVLDGERKRTNDSRV